MQNFFERVYEQVKKVPAGCVASYGQIAARCGNARMARQVGWALHVNPDPKTIPCHRIVTKDGCVSRAFAFGGEDTQRRMLIAEGVLFSQNGTVKKEFFMPPDNN